MLGGRAGSRQGRYAQAASTYVFGSHGLCLYLHQAVLCTRGYSSLGRMVVSTCPKEMARPPRARAAGEMDDGQSAPQLPAAASSQQQSSQDLEAMQTASS